MHLPELTQKVKLLDGAHATVHEYSVTIKGPKGELTRVLGNKRVAITVKDGNIILTSMNATRNDKRSLQTSAAHIRGMLKGVTEGHVYKLKICSGHFPMSVTLKGKTLEVKNFIGEAVPRKLTLKEGCDVKIDGQEITVQSNNKEIAGNQASDIERLTRRPGFDPRVFQDGIHIIEKDGRAV